jgi:ketosteroid isomerase-like protein
MSGSATDDVDRAVIRRLTAELLTAVNASDPGRLLALWADDGVLMPPNQPAVHGRDIRVAGDVAFEPWRTPLRPGPREAVGRSSTPARACTCTAGPAT